MNKKFILYISGGSMLGVFGAGVVSKMEEMDLYKNIEAVYASSAGALTAAYFLSHQTKIGSSIFYDDLTHNFVSVPNFFGGIWDRIKNRFIKTVPLNVMRDAVDINYLFNAVLSKKKLDIKSVFNQPIQFYIKLFNINARKVEYFDAKKHDLLELLRAATLLVPYVHEIYKTKGAEYIDASIIDPIGINHLIGKYPDRKIVVIFNARIKRKLKYKIKNFIEGKIMSYMYSDNLFRCFKEAESKLRKDLDIIQSKPNILLMHPSRKSPARSRTTDRNKLLETYEEGRRAAESIIQFISTNGC